MPYCPRQSTGTVNVSKWSQATNSQPAQPFPVATHQHAPLYAHSAPYSGSGVVSSSSSMYPSLLVSSHTSQALIPQVILLTQIMYNKI